MSAPRERGVASPSNWLRRDARHLVARRDEAEDLALPRARIRRSRRCRVARAARVVDHDAAALADRRARAARASSSRGRMPAENTIMSVSRCVPSANCMRCARRLAVDDRLRVLAGMHRARPAPRSCCAARAPPPSSTCTAIRRGANSTTCVSQAHVAQRLRAFETEQAAADHRAASSSARRIRASLRGPRSCGRRSSRRDRARHAAARTDRSRSRAPACRRRASRRSRPSRCARRDRSTRPARSASARSSSRSKKPGATSDRSSAVLPAKNSDRCTRS